MLDTLLLLLLGAEHIFIFHLEAFKWYKGAGKGFGTKSEHLPVTAVLAANQGYYNFILACGFFWSIYTQDIKVQLFFTSAVFGAGVFGYVSTGSFKILQAQVIPSTLTYVAILFSRSASREPLLWLVIGAYGIGSYMLGQTVLRTLQTDRTTWEQKQESNKSK